MGFSGLPQSPTAEYTAAPSTPTKTENLNSNTEEIRRSSTNIGIRKSPIRIMLGAIAVLSMIVIVRTGLYTSAMLDVPESSYASTTTRIRTQSHKKYTNETISWMDRIVMRRAMLADVSHKLKAIAGGTKRKDKDLMIDLSILHEAVVDTVRDVGVRGLLFDVLSDDFEYYVYTDESTSEDEYGELEWYEENCSHKHGVGDGCNEWDVWWTYHYIGAIVTDMLLEDNVLLWDGSSGETISTRTIKAGANTGLGEETDEVMAELLDRIHHLQADLPYVTQASFHAQHALIWRYVEKFPERLAKSYPFELALKWCRGDGSIPKGIEGRPVGKGVSHECFHGFGHAMFYAVASKQLQEEKQRQPIREEDPNKDERFLVLRPHSGFQLSRDSYCELHDLCMGASPPSEEREAMDPNDEASHNSYRICFEGVVHSVRLLSDDYKHMTEKSVAIKTVSKMMKKCARDKKQD